MDTRLYNLGESLHLCESDVGEPPHEQMRHIRDQFVEPIIARRGIRVST